MADRSRGGNSSVTIYDIAAEAGVNPSTVSRALSRPGRVSARMETRIKAAASRLNYAANPMARALPTGRTMNIGLMFTDLANPIVFEVMRGAQNAATGTGYTLLLAESSPGGPAEEQVASKFAPAVDGLVLVTTRMSDDGIQALARNKPLMLIERSVPGVADVSAPVETGIEQAVQHLHQLGHTHVGYAPGPAGIPTNDKRLRALTESTSRRVMALDVLPAAQPTVDGGNGLFDAVRDAGVTAVVAFNDLMAIGLLQAAQAAGVRIPGDLSIIGIDDIFGSEFTSPQLTTVHEPLAAIGEAAVLGLAAALEGTTADPVAELTTRLVARGSTGRRETPGSST